MSALSDSEDPPPLALAAPVHVARDASNRPEDFSERERSSLERTHAALGQLRLAVEANTSVTRQWVGAIERMGREMGDRKTFESALALDLASLRGLKANGLAGKRVLVVDDNEHFLDVCERVLGELGCNVTAASSRLDAETLLAAVPRPFHLAIVDLHLPDSSDGLELCRWIANAYPSVRVIVMSGLLEADGLDELAVARLEKPITIASFKSAMYGALGMIDTEKQTEPPPSTPWPPRDGFDSAAEEDTEPSILVQLPSTGRETAEAKRED